MIKKLMLAIAMLVASTGFAFAQVDVNKADAAALDSVKGVGPSMSKTILTERSKGEFKDWADFQKRVKGVGDKTAIKLSEAGLQVNGKAKEGAPMAAKTDAKAAKTDAKAAKADAKTAKMDTKMDTKAAKTDTKSEAKMDAKSAKDSKTKPAESKSM
ncbi:ComEA family DNA-binding protein [Massilia litorea]|uniref:Helix-hairpin-helix domain-containing protein n=1 Tax=Massilia litorea TaxID=2769491 RepID=A0A7L9U619_9BURK|nr:helix-hairpin-helix domain-containing protein [Massilia litorea]QOL49605.1 helix-hairpin-helix domain-containing protein [Massilia litorea]